MLLVEVVEVVVLLFLSHVIESTFKKQLTICLFAKNQLFNFISKIVVDDDLRWDSTVPTPNIFIWFKERYLRIGKIWKKENYC